MDSRYEDIKIVSHDENKIQSIPVDNSQSILLLAQNVDVVGIDEAQFFDDEITSVCGQLAMNGICFRRCAKRICHCPHVDSIAQCSIRAASILSF